MGFLATLDNVIGWGFVCLQFGFSGYFGQCYWVGFCLFVCCFLFVLSVFLRPWTVLLSRFLFVSLFCSLFPPSYFQASFNLPPPSPCLEPIVVVWIRPTKHRVIEFSSEAVSSRLLLRRRLLLLRSIAVYFFFFFFVFLSFSLSFLPFNFDDGDCDNGNDD